MTFDACFPDSVVGFISKPNVSLVEYVYYYFQCIQQSLEDNAMGVAQKNINLAILNSMSIPLPPISLQQEFASKIEMIERQKSAISQSIAETRKLFDYTMDKYFG
jgi:type I restriction enzyme S subunit